MKTESCQAIGYAATAPKSRRLAIRGGLRKRSSIGDHKLWRLHKLCRALVRLALVDFLLFFRCRAKTLDRLNSFWHHHVNDLADRVAWGRCCLGTKSDRPQDFAVRPLPFSFADVAIA